MKPLSLQVMDLVGSYSYLEYPGEECYITVAFQTKLAETLASKL